MGRGVPLPIVAWVCRRGLCPHLFRQELNFDLEQLHCIAFLMALEAALIMIANNKENIFSFRKLSLATQQVYVMNVFH